MEGLPLHFIRPWWLLAMLPGVLLPFAWRHLRRASGDWAQVCDTHLLRWLSVGDPGRHRRGAGAWLAAAGLVLGALALAGPSWQRLPDASFAARDARILVLDLSASMLAQDLKPDRLTRVRYRLSDLLAETVEGQVGLVAYAGDAYVVAPLTNDTNTIANLLPALRPDIMPSAGSRADRGLELAGELLRRSGLGTGEILLISDAAEPRDADIAARLRADGILTSVLAVGTRKGAPIPSGNGFVSDGNGNVVIASLDLDALGAVAAAGGGRLSRLASDAARDLPWQQAGSDAFARREDGLGERWRDSGPWLVLLLLPLAASAFRRGLLFVLPLALLPALGYAPAARASLWEDLWLRRDQQAQAALEEARTDKAAALAEDPRIAGEAWYRAGEYERAAAEWAQAESAAAHYNRGNALAKAGELDAAIAAYDQALAYQPDMEDALFNRALVEQLRDQQQEQESDQQAGDGQQQGEESDSGQQGEAGEQPQESEQQDGEGEGGQEDQQQGQPGQAGEQQANQAWSEEDAQAMEQWLRRIPDDPGGLLRRKFRNEHQRRGEAAEERRSW